ncbi:MAG: hypothetical protein P0107_03200 [Nitrosomonas sp.]|nr:hypothetical protein [Nitrosomonas sp.]
MIDEPVQNESASRMSRERILLRYRAPLTGRRGASLVGARDWELDRGSLRSETASSELLADIIKSSSYQPLPGRQGCSAGQSGGSSGS